MGGIGPLPFRALVAWMDETGVTDREEREWIRELTRAMDGAYLDAMAPKKGNGGEPELPTGIPGMEAALARARGGEGR